MAEIEFRSAQTKEREAQAWAIWSEEHQAWWNPDCAGYTKSIRNAGRYTEERAASIVRNANMDGRLLNEVPFKLPMDWDDWLVGKTGR